MSDSIDLQAARQALEKEYDKLLQRTQKLDTLNGRASGRNPDRTDLAQTYIQRDQTLALNALDRERLSQVEAALQRLETDSYGQCTQCGEAIAPARLQILPSAALCMGCQTE